MTGKNKAHVTVILDDDPTGTQTVYDVTVLTDYSIDMIRRQFESNEDAFFILTNTRALPVKEAVVLIKEICTSLKAAALESAKEMTIILRGDSTLRSHFPLEADAVESIFGKADKWIVCPFFFEGGRITKRGVHYLVENEEYIPISQTVFAYDACFGYKSSNLKDWIVEKSGGRFSSHDITVIDEEKIDNLGESYVIQQITSANKIIVLSVETINQLKIATRACKTAERLNNNILYCTAASFVQRYLEKETKPFVSADILTEYGLKENPGGLVIVGSYVSRTTEQLKHLFELKGLLTLEVEISAIFEQRTSVASLGRNIDNAISNGVTVVLFTSRDLILAKDAAENLSLGKRVSDELISIVKHLKVRPSYFIAKGGITSSDIATKGLAVKKATVLGQAMAGVPVWQTDDESKFPGLRYIVFPGNVGDKDALKNIVEKLERVRSSGDGKPV